MSVFDSIHPVGVGLIIVAVLSIIIELGYQVGKRIGGGEGLSKHPVEASVTTAILGLMAFMLGFSFATAASRSASRRNLVLVDSNVASTLYLRSDFLLPDQVEPARDLIREYVRLRAGITRMGSIEEVVPTLERSAEIQKELWTLAVRARSESSSVAVNLFVTSVNELIDTDAKRQAMAIVNRFPASLWYTLGFLGALSTTMLGLSSGLHGRRSRLATSALIVAISVVAVLIIDLDRPFRALINNDGRVMDQTLRSLEP